MYVARVATTSREQNYTLKVQFSTFHWSVKPLWFSSFKCSASTLLGVWKSARCTLSRAVHLKTGKSKWFCTCSAFALENFCALCTSPLALNVHFCSVLWLCTFGKLTLPRPVHFCKAFMFALWALLRFVRFCTYALSRVCSIVHFGDIVRLCKFTLSRVVHFCTAYVFALFAFCAFLCICTFETCLACALLIHFLDFRARAQVHFEVYVHFAHF